MPVKTVQSDNITWYYINDFGTDELSYLKKNFKFHPLDLKDCAGEFQKTKLDVYRNYLFLIFQFPQLDNSGKKIFINQIYFFLGKNYVVTISKGRFKPLNSFFYKTVKNNKYREEVFSKDSGHLLYRILDSLLRSSWIMHGEVERQLRDVESEIDEGRGKDSVFDIAYLRRNILQLKAIIDPQRLVTNSLSKLNTGFISSEMSIYFDDIDDFIEKNLYILESDQDRILSLQEINESLISYRTNQTMKVLTIFSVALLPLTLLSGIYGMNISLPFGDHPRVVWMIFVSTALALLAVFFYLKKKNWI